mgnify:CR=1 FL=1
MDWDKLRVFHAVAEAVSCTHAGDILNLSQSATSRQISGLEDSLQVPLFHRHARGLKLTGQGELLYRTAHDVFAKLAMVEAQIAERKDRPQGPLKVTTTVAFGSIWLTPRMKEFVGLYPDIDVSVVLADTELDSAMTQKVEGRDPLGDPSRVVGGELDDPVGESDLLGSLARRSQKDFGSRGVGVLFEEMVLHLPGVVVTEAVGEFDLVEGILQ